MARVTFVKKAQQRYATKPVIDPETGVQKITPVLRKDGTPKTTRAKANRPARAIVLRVTEADKDRPLPLLKCDACGDDIKIGTALPQYHRTATALRGGRSAVRPCLAPLESSQGAMSIVTVERGAAETRYIEDVAGCWLWTGPVTPKGYGRQGSRLAHRVVYERLVGPIPKGLTLDHLCRQPGCVRPSHLEPVTMRVNLLRGDTVTAANAAVTECPQGHAYDATNTYVTKQGVRQCRPCHAARERVRRSQR